MLLYKLGTRGGTVHQVRMRPREDAFRSHKFYFSEEKSDSSRLVNIAVQIRRIMVLVGSTVRTDTVTVRLM